MQGTLSLALVLGAGVLGTGVASLSWLHRDRPGARPLTLFLVASSLWALFHGLELSAVGLAATGLWARAGLVAWAAVPLAWFLTVLEYTGNGDWLTRRRLAALLVEPGLFAALVWTTAGPDGHGLVWATETLVVTDGTSTVAADYGLAFWAHTGYAYALVLAGGLLLVRLAARSPGLYRSQSTALFVAIALPMIASALRIFGLVPTAFDPTAVAYVLTGAVLAWAMFRTRLLSLSPLTRELGREEAVANLDDRVIVLDDADRIVDANPAAESLLGAPLADLLEAPLADVLPALHAAVADADGTADLALEHEGTLRYFDVRVSPLSRAGGTLTGRLVSLRDVTDRRQREQRLDVLNRLLRHNIRNELNVVRGNASLARRAVTDPAVERRLDRITQTADAVARRSDKIGRLTRALEPEALGPGSVETAVHDAVASAETADADAVRVDVSADVAVRGARSLTAAVRELVENAVAHGSPSPRSSSTHEDAGRASSSEPSVADAPEDAVDHGGDGPSVTVRVDIAAGRTDWVEIVVADDGPGIEPHEYRSILAGEETTLDHGSGVGLWLVNWILTEVGGTVSFEPSDAGTTVRCLVPRADGTGGASPPATGGDDGPVATDRTGVESVSGMGGSADVDGPGDPGGVGVADGADGG